MIYTCYEMVRDCRANLPEGWTHFIVNYVPAIQGVLEHYSPGRTDGPAMLERVLTSLRASDSPIFRSAEPPEERWFVSQLRQFALAAIPSQEPEIEIDLATVASALEPLTMTEKQAAWLETMLWSPADAGPMLRVSAETVEKVRARSAELIRGKVDAWRRTLLVENGAALGRHAAAATGEDCLPAKAFLDVIDGRTAWRGRETMDHHVKGCLHCVDHFCRLLEVVHLLRRCQPLTQEEAAPFRRMFGLAEAKPAGWKRLLHRA
jgi:hypothetical protein